VTRLVPDRRDLWTVALVVGYASSARTIRDAHMNNSDIAELVADGCK
jgi:hypothetical protein